MPTGSSERAKQASHLGKWVPWAERGSLRADAWVQATTVGLKPGEPSPAAPNGARVAVELNYKGGPTAFQQAALRYINDRRTLPALLAGLQKTQHGAGSSPGAKLACAQP